MVTAITSYYHLMYGLVLVRTNTSSNILSVPPGCKLQVTTESIWEELVVLVVTGNLYGNTEYDCEHGHTCITTWPLLPI